MCLSRARSSIPAPQTTFWTQARALFLKNAAYQRSQRRSNIVIILYPVFFCVLLFILQKVINNALKGRDNQVGFLL